MSLSHKEKFGERRRGNGTARRVYVITGTAGESETDVYSYLLNTAADSISGLVITDASCDEVANVGDRVHYVGEVQYGLSKLPAAQAVSEIRVSSRASLANTNLKFSRSTVGSHAASWFKGDGSVAGSTKDFGGKVGVQADGSVAGVDVPTPQNVLSVSNVIPIATLDEAKQYEMEQLVGKTNSAVYRSRAIGTLLCSGVAFQQSDSENMAVSAEFLFERNLTGLAIDGITGIDKKGWEYIWAYTVERKDDGRVGPAVAQINVEAPFESANFATVLGF